MTTSKLIFFLLTLYFFPGEGSLVDTFSLVTHDVTKRPIIGVLAQEQDPPYNGTYIPSSYVKAVESAGARVVPVFVDRSLEYYKEMINVLNGMVFPGGNVNLTATKGFARAAKIIFDLSKELNKKGIKYPILGVCQGMEILAIFTNDNKDMLNACKNMENRALPIKFKHGFRYASLFSRASKQDIAILATLPTTSHHHHWCVTEKNFTKLGLDKFWRVLTVNKDGRGEEYISTMQAHEYPFVGVQYHPEKVAYEWNPTQNNPHSLLAVKANRLFYDWLVQTARQNNHKFNKTNIEESSLIYNYQQYYSGKETDFQQQYIFKK